jgi:DNA-binding transcriptional LysR family regulator
MEPTPRALDIAAPLRQSLADLRAIVQTPERFDPAVARRTFRVSGGDYAAMVLLPPLFRVLERDAPHVDLRFRFIEKGRVLGCLDDEEVDLALAVMGDAPKRFGCERLLTDTFVCVMRQDNPLADEPVSIQRFIAQRHILVTERGDETGAVDVALARVGLSRRVVLTVPLVSLVPMLLVESDAVATVGRLAADRLAQTAAIRIRDVPVSMPPWHMNLIWSARRERDDGLMWLRQQLKGMAQAL